MQALLEDLHSLSGVIGCAFCDVNLGVLSRAFPPEFDDGALEAVAAALAASAPSLRNVTGTVGVIDLRFRGGRVLVRPVGNAALLVLCDKSANAQEVLAFASVACKKFERLRQAGTAVGPPQTPPSSALAPSPAPSPPPPRNAPDTRGSPPVAHEEAPRARRMKRAAWGLVLAALAGAGGIYGYKAVRTAGAIPDPKTALGTLGSKQGEPALPRETAARPDVWLRVSGSDSLSGRLLSRLLAAYLRSQKATEIQEIRRGEESVRVRGTLEGKDVEAEVELGGTAKGLSDLLAGTADIAATARRVRTEERSRLAVLGAITSPANEHVVALDGVAVIVNKANTVQALNHQQLARLLSGAATDWSQFGLVGEEEWSEVGVAGKGGPVASGVHVYLPEEPAGVTELVQGAVLGARIFASDARRLPSVEAVADAVAADPGGIGLVPMRAVGGARSVPICDLDDPPLLATPFTVASEDYLLTHRLYFYTAQGSSNPQVARFVSFVLSTDGQAEVRKAGLVELGVNAEDRPVPTGAPVEYTRLTAGALRLSTTFRFEVGSSGFDSRAQRDLDRVVEYLRQHDLGGGAVRLLGFTDGSGPRTANLQLSRERATLLAQALAQRGITGTAIAAMGSAMPVADNSGEEGRSRNRRVEVWITRR